MSAQLGSFVADAGAIRACAAEDSGVGRFPKPSRCKVPHQFLQVLPVSKAKSSQEGFLTQLVHLVRLFDVPEADELLEHLSLVADQHPFGRRDVDPPGQPKWGTCQP